MRCETFVGLIRAALCLVVLSFALTALRAQDSATHTAKPSEPTEGNTPATQPEAPRGWPVKLGNTVLFYVQARVLEFSPEDRAKTIAQRVLKLSHDPRTKPSDIHIREDEDSSEIVLGKTVIMAVTDRDARGQGVDRQQLAEQLAERIRAAIGQHQSDYGLRATLIALAWTALATVLMLVALKLLRWSALKLYTHIDGWRGTRIHAIRFQHVELLTADRITDALISFARALRFILTLLLFYLYLPTVLSFFPWTRGWAGTLIQYILRPLRLMWDGLIHYLPNLFFIAVILVVAYYAVGAMKFIFDEIGRGRIELSGFYRDWARPTYKIARFFAVVFAAIVVFPYLPGSDSPAFQGISIFLGVLFSLGSTSAVSNIVAGTVLTYTRAFQTGDRVKIGDTTGDVVEKNLLITQVSTIKNATISIPNAMVLASHIINYSASAKQEGLILNATVTIGYNAPWRRIHELLLSAAKNTAHVMEQPAPFILQTGLDDFYVRYELNVYTRAPQHMATIYSELYQNIQDQFSAAGVEIMSPHYSALRDGNAAALPAEALPATYQAPGFKFEASAR